MTVVPYSNDMVVFVLLTLEFVACVFVFQVAEHSDYLHDIRHCHGTLCDHAVDVRLLVNWNDKTKHLRQYTMYRWWSSVCCLCTIIFFHLLQ